MILTWFQNTSIPSIQVQLAPYDVTKEAWDFLAARFHTTGLTHYYHLIITLHSLRQEPGQTVNEFLAQTQPIRHQLWQANIQQDHLDLIETLMALRPEYEVVRASLLHRHPLPTLDATIQEITFEETRLRLSRLPHLDSALAVSHQTPSTSTHLSRPSSSGVCRICKSPEHAYRVCPKVECHICHVLGHIAPDCPNKSQRSGGVQRLGRVVSRPRNNHGPFSPVIPGVTVAATDESQGQSYTLQDIEAIVKQVISSHSAMSTTSGLGFEDGSDHRYGPQDWSAI